MTSTVTILLGIDCTMRLSAKFLLKMKLKKFGFSSWDYKEW